MTRVFIVLFLFLYSFSAISQGRADPSEEELAQSKALKEKFNDEDLIILSKEISITFEKNRDGFVEVVKENSVHFMNISSNSRMQYPVFYDSESKVENFDLKDGDNRTLKGYSYTIQDEYLKSQDLFHTDYRVKYVNLIFPLQGTNFKVVTEKKYNDVKYFTSEYFSDIFRTLDGKITIHIPEWLNLDIKEFNFEGNDIQKKEEKDSKERVVTFHFKNIEPQSDESSTPGPSYIYPHILFIAKSFTQRDKTVTLFNDTKDLYGWYNGLINNVTVDASVFADKVKELTSGDLSEEDKIKNIFYWVQDNIRYIAFEDGLAGFQPDSPQNVFKKRYGDCKGMAFLTKSMLEEAGFDSRLVWIGTDRLVYDYSIPSLSVDNHMICSVMLNDEPIFLDGTEKYNRFGDYATRIQNKQALLQDKEGFKIYTVPEPKNFSNLDKTTYKLKIEDEVLTGVANRNFGGECRVNFQNIYTSLGKGDQSDILSKYLASGNSNFNVNEVEPFDESIREKDLAISYNVNIKKAVSEFDGTLYIDVDPVKIASDYIFSERKSDYKFQIKKRNVTEISLDVPQGYSLETMPKNISISNDLVDISVTYLLSDNTIKYTKNINLKKRHIKKGEFELWNNSFAQLKDNLNEQITLVKK